MPPVTLTIWVVPFAPVKTPNSNDGVWPYLREVVPETSVVHVTVNPEVAILETAGWSTMYIWETAVIETKQSRREKYKFFIKYY